MLYNAVNKPLECMSKYNGLWPLGNPCEPWKILGKKLPLENYLQPPGNCSDHRRNFKKSLWKKKSKVEFNLPINFFIRWGLALEFLEFLELHVNFLCTWNIPKNSFWSWMYLNVSWIFSYLWKNIVFFLPLCTLVVLFFSAGVIK